MPSWLIVSLVLLAATGLALAVWRAKDWLDARAGERAIVEEVERMNVQERAVAKAREESRRSNESLAESEKNFGGGEGQ